MSGFFDQIFCHINERYSIIIEEDDKVCYAYLLEEDRIIGDVWLYNIGKTPNQTDWGSKENMPFLNPIEYVNLDKMIRPIISSEDLKVDWKMVGEELNEAHIYIRNERIAKMKPGFKPGWSSIVLKDGPLAKVLK